MHITLHSIMFVLLTALLFACTETVQEKPHSFPPRPPTLLTSPGAERIDLFWAEPDDWHNQRDWFFEVYSRLPEQTDFKKIHDNFLSTPAYSDLTAPVGVPVEYRVRTVLIDATQQVVQASAWSDTKQGIANPMNTSNLLSEVQRAAFRYFWNYSHPVSGLPREGAGSWEPNMCSIAGTGMMFFNIAVGIENKWITYEEALRHADKVLTFLTEKADRFHGVFPHWINGQTGKTIPFSSKDDGADLVETSFLISGALFFREYISKDNSALAVSIRDKANRIWEDVEWSWFVKERPDGRRPLLWHWSPNHGFAIDLEVVGFTECHMTYILALASPTHPVTSDSYFNGWMGDGYGRERLHYDIKLELGREEYGPPLFFTHYSYLGIHPEIFTYNGKKYFDHFMDFCRIQILWTEENRPELRSTGIWGMTAGLEPGGYGVHFPGNDNGTISPTAFLSSIPYAPEAAIHSMEQMYIRYRHQFWGPFGFYDAMNLTQNWFSDKYIAIDVGPIAPMIENYKSGLCWNTFMQAPEFIRALDIINRGP